MWLRRTLQGSHKEIEIEDLLEEVGQLKLRLSMIERRKKLELLDRDFNGVRGKYAATIASRSLVPNQFLRTDDDNKGILDDQFFSTYEDVFEGPPRQSSTSSPIDSSFKEFKDPWTESSSLPIYDKPVYDVYDDDISVVLDLDQPYGDDASKLDASPELVLHNIPNKTTNMFTVIDGEMNIQSHMPLHHLDVPQVLQDEYEGWLSPKIIDDFKELTDVYFKEFGDTHLDDFCENAPKSKQLDLDGVCKDGFNINSFASFDYGLFPPHRCSHPYAAEWYRKNILIGLANQIRLLNVGQLGIFL